MKILFTAFNGINNSSKILLDNINCPSDDKLYLKNSYITSVSQLKKKLKNNYDLIVSFGQAPLNPNHIKIETQGTLSNTFTTNYDYTNLKKHLESLNFHVSISNNAGRYFCNNIYYHGLKYIYENNLSMKMIFIHIPKIDNKTKFDLLSENIKDFLNS